jgi:hypothetical protein
MASAHAAQGKKAKAVPHTRIPVCLGKLLIPARKS